MRRRTSTLLLAAPTWAGCSSGTGPLSLDQDYALVTVGGEPLPVSVGSRDWVADTIHFQAGDKWTRVTRLVLEEGLPPDSVRWESDGFVVRDGDRIVLDFDCPPGALCVAPDTLHPTVNGLVRWGNHGEGAPPTAFRYQPID